MTSDRSSIVIDECEYVVGVLSWLAHKVVDLFTGTYN